MKRRRGNKVFDSLREELGSQAGASVIMGGFSELPVSYLECPGGLCRAEEEPRSGADACRP